MRPEFEPPRFASPPPCEPPAPRREEFHMAFFAPFHRLSIGSSLLTIAVFAVHASAQTYAGPGGPIPAAGTGGGAYSAIAPCAPAVGGFLSSFIVVPVPVGSVDQIQLDGWSHTWVGDEQIVLIDPALVGHNIMVRPGFNSAGAFGNSGDRT